MKKRRDYGIIFWAHFIFDMFLICSWFLFSWKIVLVACVILKLQWVLLGGCVLSKAEFDNKEACIPYYLKKWRFIKNKERMRFFVDYFLLVILVILSLIFQLLLHFKPLII
jgi:hypothetical protein